MLVRPPLASHPQLLFVVYPRTTVVSFGASYPFHSDNIPPPPPAPGGIEALTCRFLSSSYECQKPRPCDILFLSFEV